MRKLIVRVFRLSFRLTNLLLLSFIFSLAYVSLLCMMMMYGLTILADGIFPATLILKLFSFPYIYGTAATVLLLNYIIAPPWSYFLSKRERKTNYMPVMMYTLLSLLVFAFSLFGDRIF